MKCPHCNQEHPDNYQFCPEIGKKIEVLKACPNPNCPECGKSIPLKDCRFCPYCGCELPTSTDFETDVFDNNITEIENSQVCQNSENPNHNKNIIPTDSKLYQACGTKLLSSHIKSVSNTFSVNEELPETIKLNIENDVYILLRLVEGNAQIPTFYIGTTPVTQGLWKTILGDCDWIEKWGNETDNYFPYGSGDKYPIYGVDVIECENFIEVLKSGSLPWPSSKLFDLPTELQWEYAAQGGKENCSFLYSGSNNLDEVGWWIGNSAGKTHEVATKKPNSLGIFDMSGNVAEWCHKNNSSDEYVLKGGSFRNSKKMCNIFQRNTNLYYGIASHSTIGFRLVLNLDKLDINALKELSKEEE